MSLNPLWPFDILLLRIFCLVLCPIFKVDYLVLFGILMSSFLSSLYILEISPLSDVVLVKIFSHSVSLSY